MTMKNISEFGEKCKDLIQFARDNNIEFIVMFSDEDNVALGYNVTDDSINQIAEALNDNTDLKRYLQRTIRQSNIN